ncbi:MAG TPA: roadblock/LC7 domain-containing protein [Thermomicrobiaceae bacterium]|nr:roadblock/LC7 domain-containing protein [Thermomicrobiaceae bacterium]
MSGFDRSLSRLIITEEDRMQIVTCLQRLMTDSGASYCMVIDRSGQVLAWESDQERPEMTYLGALIAATYASTQEMARILKEDGFKTLLQEGLKERVYTETIRDRWLLVVIFDQQSQVGLVKVLARRESIVLTGVLQLSQERGDHPDAQRFRRIGKATTDTIDLIFKDNGCSDDE